ncbi:MAG TPA: hypothetical protein VF610_09155 [Segetibacter sp.]
MRFISIILTLAVCCSCKPVALYSQSKDSTIFVDFYGDSIEVAADLSNIGPSISFLSDSVVQAFYERFSNSGNNLTINNLLAYREKYQLDDWLYYQLVRSTAERMSPKAANYQRYTLCKWFLLVKSGYATTISIRREKLLLYIQSNDEVFNIPYRMVNGGQYICLNYHDYGAIDFEKEKFTPLQISIPAAQKSFTYQIKKIPLLGNENYSVKELQFDYYQTAYYFKVMMNNQIKKVFKNYPVVDYKTYFNIPLSKITYSSLVPALRENIAKMSKKDGVDYLMRFTRYAFSYETDTKIYGSENRLSPELTLLSDNSDCEDRAALFFYLVRELYNIPMIVLAYPEHITIAVEFDKLSGEPIEYNGKKYWVCEPTPQRKDLRMGQSIKSLRKASYQIVYAYNPEVSP